MRRLYRAAKGELHQVLVADYSLADIYRNHLDPGYPTSRRAIVRTAKSSWKISAPLLGRRLAFRLCALVWALAGLPTLLMRGLRLGAGGFTRSCDEHASIILLRTGVANEPRIAEWISREHGNTSVCCLQLNEAAPVCRAGIVALPAVIGLYFRLVSRTVRCVTDLFTTQQLSSEEFDVLAHGWLVLVSRRAIDICWGHQWARRHLDQTAVTHLYFTMNYAYESAFQHALPASAAAYVEHGFPRRDIPPLPATQYVYSEMHARYLESFDPDLETEVIGLDYFPKGRVEPTRTIVIATLQDWPQYGIGEVQDLFNQALRVARNTGWRIVFRTRRYDTDAFANALEGPWDAISEPSAESFDQCLHRFKPAMVWTSWSTAILDARAMGIGAVCFVSDRFEQYFVADLNSIAKVVRADGEGFDRLAERLRQKRLSADHESEDGPEMRGSASHSG